MKVIRKPLSKTFNEFFESEKSSGITLIICTILSLIIANSMVGEAYVHFWHTDLGGLSVELWVNDLLMAVFFLLIGLELKRELSVGELSNLKQALLPIFAAFGGVAVPALIHLAFNFGTDKQAGVGIPMATDIAFALGVLALLGSRVPASLKVFLTALAVIDDLVAIIVIAVFYTAELSIAFLVGSLAVLVLLYACGRFLKINFLLLYLVGGAVAWYLMFKSGVHATIAGVLLAFVIPSSAKADDENSLSEKMEHFLHKPVAFLILPIFALANTGIIIEGGILPHLVGPNSIGIMAGLFIGKPLGITLTCMAVVAAGLCKLPLDLNWKHVFGAGLLGGIGFTMSIFITNLAFTGNNAMIVDSKMAILVASMAAGLVGFVFLKLFGQLTMHDDDPSTTDYSSS